MAIIKKWIRLSGAEKRMLVEALVLLPMAKCMILFFPFKKIVKKLGKLDNENARLLTDAEMEMVARIKRVVGSVAIRMPYKSKCFDQAITAKLMLNRRQIPSTVYFGVANDPENKLEAHAWVRSGAKMVTGGRGHQRFEVLAAFS